MHHQKIILNEKEKQQKKVGGLYQSQPQKFTNL